MSRFRFYCLGMLVGIGAAGVRMEVSAQSEGSAPQATVRQTEEETDSIPTVTDLEEFVVKGESYSMQDGKLTIAPPEGVVATSQFAPDLLGNLGIPGLRYDAESQTVSVNGAAPVILINGTIANPSRLKTIKASDVLSVQFTRNVPLVYQRYGSVLIDIRLRKIHEGGTILAAAESDMLLYAQGAQLDATYNRGPSQWSLSYVYSRRNNSKVHDINTTSYTSPQLNVDITSEGESPFRYNTHSPSLNYIYNPSRDILLQANLSLYAHNQHFNTNTHAHDSMAGDYATKGESRAASLSPTLNLYFQKTFGSADMLQVDMSGTMANSDYTMLRDYTYTDPAEDETYLYDTRSRRRALLTTVAYTHTFGETTSLEVDYENTVARTVNRYNTPDEPYRVSQLDNHLYAQLQKGFGPVWLTINTGIRLDYMKERSISRRYLHNTSSLAINWTINRAMWLSFRAGYTPLTIEPSQFIDHQQKVSPYRVTSGNPDLRMPQHWDILADYTVKLGKVSLIPQVVYNRNHYLVATSYAYDPQWEAFVEKPVNLVYSDILIGRLQGSAQEVAGMFNFSGSVEYSHANTKWRGGEKTILNCVYAYLQAQWYYRQWAAGVSYNFPCRNLVGDNITKSGPLSVLWATWRPNGHWTLMARWSYMLEPRGWTYYSQQTAPGYYSTFDRSIRNSANAVSITATYYCQFGDIFRTSSRSRTIGKKDNAKIYTTFD